MRTIAYGLGGCLAASGLCAACGDSQKQVEQQSTDAAADRSRQEDAQASDAGSETGGDSDSDGGGEVEAATDSNASESACPEGLECLSPTGIYLCAKPGSDLILCDRQADCSFGTCYQVSGQGVCVVSCAPEEGFPKETSIRGRVVEFEAGKGVRGVDETAVETPLENVEVCVDADRVDVPCVMSDAEGRFEVTGLPPNRSSFTSVPGVVTFTKDGYLTTGQGFGLGAGPQFIGTQVRMLKIETAQTIATANHAPLPSETLGWMGIALAQSNEEDVRRLSAFAEGNFKLVGVENASIGFTAPSTGDDGGAAADGGEAEAADGGGASDGGAPDPRGTGWIGPIYADAKENLSKDATSTSIAGTAFVLDATMMSYTVSFSHPSLDCGSPVMLTPVPGMLLWGLSVLCGHGVQ